MYVAWQLLAILVKLTSTEEMWRFCSWGMFIAGESMLTFGRLLVRASTRKTRSDVIHMPQNQSLLIFLRSARTGFHAISYDEFSCLVVGDFMKLCQL